MFDGFPYPFLAELWLSLSFFGASKKMLRLATSMTSPSLVLFFAKGYGTTPLGDGLDPGGRGMGDGNDTHWFKGKSWEHHAKIWELHKWRMFSSGKKWRHSGCSPAMLDYWYSGGSWDPKMVEKSDWPDFSVKGATAENWIKYIQVFMS